MRQWILALISCLVVGLAVARPGPDSNYNQNIVAGGGGSFTTWNNADFSQVLFSNGNLTATGNSAGTDGGTRSVSSKASSKFYVEFTPTTSAGADTGFGGANAGATFAALGNAATGGFILYRSGNLWVGGSSVLNGATAAWTNGVAIGMAVDIGNSLVWYTQNGTTWSNSGNPAAGTGGVSFSGVTGPFFLACTFNNGSADVITLNAGATAFSFSAPAGFTSGWP